jgi:hypothetical protein
VLLSLAAVAGWRERDRLHDAEEIHACPGSRVVVVLLQSGGYHGQGW